MDNNSPMNYWRWFFKGSGAQPGYRRLLNRWIILHLFSGVIVALVVPIDLQTAANTVLLPLVGILIGLSFAWAGNAQALLQSAEIDKLSDHHEGGFVEYVFTYQTAILAILVTLVVWGLAGLHVFDAVWPSSRALIAYFAIKTFLFLLVSLTLRECWHVVMGAQWLLLVQREIRKHDRDISNNKK